MSIEHLPLSWPTDPESIIPENTRTLSQKRISEKLQRFDMNFVVFQMLVPENCGPTWRGDALFWDRPRVVYHRVYFSIRRKNRKLSQALIPETLQRFDMNVVGIQVQYPCCLKEPSLHSERSLVRTLFVIQVQRHCTLTKCRGTSLIRKRLPPYDHHRGLGTVLL